MVRRSGGGGKRDIETQKRKNTETLGRRDIGASGETARTRTPRHTSSCLYAQRAQRIYSALAKPNPELYGRRKRGREEGRNGDRGKVASNETGATQSPHSLAFWYRARMKATPHIPLFYLCDLSDERAWLGFGSVLHVRRRHAMTNS